MDSDAISKRILEEFKDFGSSNEIYALITPADYHHKVSDLAMVHLAKEVKLNGVYVSLNIAYEQKAAHLKKLGIDTDRMFFIDACSKSGSPSSAAKNCVLIQSPQALTELSIAITTVCNTGKFDFLYFDSLTTLLIFNELKTTEKFIHYMISKMRTFNLKGIILSMDEEKSKELLSMLEQLCDKMVHFVN